MAARELCPAQEEETMAIARRKRRTGAGVKKGIEEVKEMQARGMFSFSFSKRGEHNVFLLGSVTHSAFLNGVVAGSNRWRAHRVLCFVFPSFFTCDFAAGYAGKPVNSHRKLIKLVFLIFLILYYNAQSIEY
jgi:hypothetical protein